MLFQLRKENSSPMRSVRVLYFCRSLWEYLKFFPSPFSLHDSIFYFLCTTKVSVPLFSLPILVVSSFQGAMSYIECSAMQNINVKEVIHLACLHSAFFLHFMLPCFFFSPFTPTLIYLSHFQVFDKALELLLNPNSAGGKPSGGGTVSSGGAGNAGKRRGPCVLL